MRFISSARDPRVPWYAKAVALAVAAYALSPIDLIPGFHSGARLSRRTDHRAAGHTARRAAHSARRSSPSTAPTATSAPMQAEPQRRRRHHRHLDRPGARRHRLRHLAISRRQHKEARHATPCRRDRCSPCRRRRRSRITHPSQAPRRRQGVRASPHGRARGRDLRRRLLLVDGIRTSTRSRASSRRSPASWAAQTPNPTYEQVSTATPATPKACRSTTTPRSSAIRSSSTTTGTTSISSTAAGSSATAATSTGPVIFAHTPEQKQAAADSKAALDASQRFSTPIAVPIVDAGPFTPAEDYHQNFHNTNPQYYKRYRAGCGRDARLKEMWGAEADSGGALRRRRAARFSSCGGRTTRRSPASASAGSCRSSRARRRRRGCWDRRCRRRMIPPALGPVMEMVPIFTLLRSAGHSDVGSSSWSPGCPSTAKRLKLDRSLGEAVVELGRVEVVAFALGVRVAQADEAADRLRLPFDRLAVALGVDQRESVHAEIVGGGVARRRRTRFQPCASAWSNSGLALKKASIFSLSLRGNGLQQLEKLLRRFGRRRSAPRSSTDR